MIQGYFPDQTMHSVPYTRRCCRGAVPDVLRASGVQLDGGCPRLVCRGAEGAERTRPWALRRFHRRGGIVGSTVQLPGGFGVPQ